MLLGKTYFTYKPKKKEVIIEKIITKEVKDTHLDVNYEYSKQIWSPISDS